MDFINIIYDEETEEVVGYEYIEDFELTPLQQRALRSLTGNSLLN